MILNWLRQHWRGLLVALVLGAAFLSGSWFGASKANTAWALKWKQRDADDATALAKRQAEARAEEQRRQGEIDAIEKRAEGQIAQAAADADHARAVSDGLHDEAAKLAARLAASERARCAATAAKARQAPPAASCLPSCSAALTNERENWRQLLIRQGSEG